MSPEELDEARAKEAVREMEERNTRFSFLEAATIAARKAREGWTPPELVDPDLLAFREWAAICGGVNPWWLEEVLAGKWDRSDPARGFLAGARWAREQERERAKVLVKYVEIDTRSRGGFGEHARATLAEYRGEA